MEEGIHPDIEERSTVGRPLLSIDMYEVEYMRALGFNWSDIARMLGISRSTLYRRLESSELTFHNYIAISDNELDDVIRQIKISHPNDGEVMIAAHLKARRIHVPRTRMRASIHRLDPSVRDNMRATIRRRVYYVHSPNNFWHIDGNHKLIRWRIIVHGGIDGYSRVVVFLKASSNNYATTMLTCFQKGVADYGLPVRVRSDLGGENVDVWRYMMQQHNEDPSCIIVGSSTHNERIERLWRDVHRCVLRPFSEKFQSLEQAGLLNPLNEVDIFCLHFCFLPRINRCIQSFQEA